MNYFRGERARFGGGSTPQPSCSISSPHHLFSWSRQEATVFNYLFFLGRCMESRLLPVYSAGTGPLVWTEGAAALTECGRMRVRVQKARQPLVENFKGRPYGPGAKHLDLLLHPSPLSWLFTCLSHHKCVFKRFVAVKIERRSTLTGFFWPRSSDW